MFSAKNWVRRKMLAKQLKSEEVEERRLAVEELGDIGDPADIPVLASALRDPETPIRRLAAKALIKVNDPAAVEPLIAALADPAEAGAWQSDVIAALEHYQDPRSVPACIAALDNHDAKVRRAAASLLGSMGDLAALEPLLKALFDPDAAVAGDAAYAIAKLGQPAMPGLLQVLQDAPAQARIAAADALGIIADTKAIPALVAALKDQDSYLQIAAAKALARIRHPSVIEPLVNALEDSSNAAFFYGVSDEASAALVKLGKPAIAPMLESLKRPATSGRGRLLIIRLLGELPDPRAVEPLVGLLSEPNLEVRQAAMTTLAKVAPQRALEALPPFLDDADFNVRHHAGELLRNAGWKPEAPRDQARLAIAVGQYAQALETGPEALLLLLERLRDAEPAVRRAVAGALAKRKDKQALPALQAAAAAESNIMVQQNLLEAMAACGPAAVEALAALVEQGDDVLGRAAVQHLLRLGWRPQTEKQQRLYAAATTKAA